MIRSIYIYNKIQQIRNQLLQQMDNFNNKIQTRQKFESRYACSDRTYPTQSNFQQIVRREGNATQFLLMLSQQQMKDKRYNTEQSGEQMIQVAPWTDSDNIIVMKKKAQNSKTSIILPPRDFINQIDKQQDKQNKKDDKPVQFQAVFKKKSKYKKKSRDYKQNKQNILSKLQIIMINKNLQQKKASKSSHSTVTRYSDYGPDWKIYHQPYHQNQGRSNNYTQPSQTHGHQLQKINCKSNTGFYNNLKTNIKYHKQHDTLQGCMIPKLEQYCSRSSTTHTAQKKYVKLSAYVSSNNSGSLTNPVLRKNTTILSQPITKFINDINMHLRRDYEEEQKEKNLYLNLKQRRQANNNKKQVIDKINQHYKAIVDEQGQENKEAKNQGYQYEKIKRQILTSVQKQGLVKLNGARNERNSKKLLAKNFKNSIFKRQRNFLNNNGQNRGQIVGGCYETSNPITKHLYDRYKKIMSKNK